jgi:amidase
MKVDFYNDITTYLSALSNTDIKSLSDIVQYNTANAGTEGCLPNIHPAFASGQDDFLAYLATQGVMAKTYYQALNFCQSATRENGIDYALTNYGNNRRVDALLVPRDVRQTYQIAAQAGYPVITIPAGINATTSMPFGLALMGTAWSEAELVRWASAIEDLGKASGKWGRTRPGWGGYRERNLPVLNL